jgi:orotidine-5'-phosphate decarboxylase
VLARAADALAAGLDGWVAPAAAADAIRAAHGGVGLLVCPGIRLPGESAADQVEVGTPAEAVRRGADWIVVGRPITQAPDPAAAVERFLESLESA